MLFEINKYSNSLEMVGRKVNLLDGDCFSFLSNIIYCRMKTEERYLNWELESWELRRGKCTASMIED